MSIWRYAGPPLLLLAAIPLGGQEPSPSPTAASLLEQAHAACLEVDATQRAAPLARVAEIAAKHRLPVTRAWIRELFELGRVYPTLGRDFPEASAARAMALLDPMGALVLLEQVQEPATQPDNYLDMRAAAAPVVFVRVYEARGVPALELLRQKSIAMGQSGEYPYQAWAQLLPKFAALQPSLAEAVFSDALAAYRTGVTNQAADQHFTQFLRATWSLVTPATARAAVEETIQQLLEKDADPQEPKEKVRFFTATGSPTFTSVEIHALRLLAVVQALDPDFHARLLAEHPVLNQPALHEVPLFVPEPLSEADSPANRRSELMTMAATAAASDSEEGFKVAGSISDPVPRSEAFSEIAKLLAQKNPERASAALRFSLAAAAEVTAPRGQFLAWGHIASAAHALHDHAVLLDATRRAFAAGAPLLIAPDEADVPKRVIRSGLVQMVHDAAGVDPSRMIAEAEAIQDPALKAALLSEVANAL